MFNSTIELILEQSTNTYPNACLRLKLKEQFSQIRVGSSPDGSNVPKALGFVKQMLSYLVVRSVDSIILKKLL